MNDLVDAAGRPIPEKQDGACPSCGAPAKSVETSSGFGGYWSKVCTKCGHVLARGRGDEVFA